MSNTSNVVTLTQEKWDQIADNLISEREGFDEEISKILFNNGNTEIKEYFIKFPTCLTVENRYSIHKYSRSNMLTSESSNVGANRYIVSKLSKNFVQYLFNCNYHGEDETPEQKYKREIFEKYMDFIQINFKDEFENYLKTLY